MRTSAAKRWALPDTGLTDSLVRELDRLLDAPRSDDPAAIARRIRALRRMAEQAQQDPGRPKG